jgi:hypothetical protein
MKSVFTFKFALGLFTLAVFGLQSCSKDAERPDVPEGAQLSQTELQTIMEAEQWTGVADDILAELYQNENSSSAKFADDSCYQTTYTDTGFTVVFGNCVLNQSQTVNGTLEVVYDTGTGGASFTATYKGFFVGQAEVNGTRTFTLTESGENGFNFSVQSDMTVLLANGSTIVESGTRTLEFQLGETLADISFSISGNWELTVEDTVYTVSVISPVTGNLSCGYLVSGVMDISKNGLQVSVDFGDGSCDNAVTVMYPNGATEELTY